MAVVACGLMLWSRGQHVQPDAVAHSIALQIGAVGHKVLVDRRQIVQDVLAANTQQGADDSLALAPHACHSAQTSSAQEVEQKGFCLVVAMMSYGNTLCSSLLDLAFEPPIAQFACRHLDAHVVQQGKFAGVEMLYRESDIEFPAQSGNKGFVAVRLLATQVKVAVQSMQAVAQLVQHAQECHRIGSSTQGHQHGTALAEQFPIPYI